MMRYGFLGMGIMGSCMAANLLKAGMITTIWNRTPERCLPLGALGAQVKDTPSAVIEASDITFAMVSDPEASEALCFGENGVLSAITEQKSYVDISTIDPHTVQKIGAAIRKKGGRYLEAPVSGSKKPAEDGTLVFLCGGDRTLFDEAQPALEVMGKKSFYLGVDGQGAKMKLVVNMIMGTMMTALGEGLCLGKKSGLDPVDLLAVLTQGAIDNPMFRLKGGLMNEQNFTPAFPLKHMQKDMRLALLLGEECAQPLASAAAANSSFLRAMAMDCGDEDFCAVLKAIAV